LVLKREMGGGDVLALVAITLAAAIGSAATRSDIYVRSRDAGRHPGVFWWLRALRTLLTLKMPFHQIAHPDL